jgi:pimeloyl-ACP methyl ester carboxylesterase
VAQRVDEGKPRLGPFQNDCMNPVSLNVPANGLTHHVLCWEASPPSVALTPSDGPRGTALLVHGFMDAAATWDLVAPALASAGLRVLALDMRGFGDGPRVPLGGYYHFPDYVFDLADVVEALVPVDSPLFLVGHSMGGTISTLYTGTFPARVARLVIVEGVGPPDGDHAHTPDRMRRWIDDVRSVRARGERTMGSSEDALRRLAGNHPRVDPAVLRTRLPALARELPDGRAAWKADALHTTRSPVPFFVAGYEAFARRVTCPVLFVSGGKLGWHPPDEDERLAAFARLERAELEDAGHMMHWTRPDDLARLLVDFFRPAGGTPL